MKCAAVVTVSLAGLALAMCPVAQADPTPKDIYYKYLAMSGVKWEGQVSEDEMVLQAESTCSALDREPTPSTYNASVERVTGIGFSPRDANIVVDAAVSAYCPQHAALG